MTRIAATAMALVCLASSPALAAADRLDLPHSERTVLVRFADGVADGAQEAAVAAAGGTIERRYRLVPGLVRVRVTTPVPAALASLRAADGVRYAEPDYIVNTLSTPSDSRLMELWGMGNTGQTGGLAGADINVAGAWAVTTGNPDQLIAVIDAGIDPNHPDLAENIWVNPGEVAGNGVDDDGNGYVDDVRGWNFLTNSPDTNVHADHGTHVAGTIGAVGDNGSGVVGVNWRCKIVPLAFIGPQGGVLSDAILAIEYAVDVGARLSNNSWGGGPYVQALYDAIEAAGAAGHLFVAAAGNAGVSDPMLPAAYANENIISVAASTHRDERAGFSNWGLPHVDVFAPGQSILSTVPGGYAYNQGTSMAAPHVAGVAGLLWAANPTWTWQQVRDRIFQTVRPVAAFDGLVRFPGVVNAGAALGGTAARPPAIALVGEWPDAIPAGGQAEVTLRITPGDDTLVPESLVAFSSIDGVFEPVAMTPLGDDMFRAVVRAGTCGNPARFYFEARGQNSGPVRLPSAGAARPVSAAVGSFTTLYADDFEGDAGWTAGVPGDTASLGLWNRGLPEFTGAQPGWTRRGNACFVTDSRAGAGPGAFDVDNGFTTLLSPRINLAGTGGAVFLSYWRWYSNNGGNNPNADVFLVDVSADDGATWTRVEAVGPSTNASEGWDYVQARLETLVPLTDRVRVRFIAQDLEGPSLVEAAVDDLRIRAFECVAPCRADWNGDGSVNQDDLMAFVNDLLVSAPGADLDGDGSIDFNDLLSFINFYNAGCT